MTLCRSRLFLGVRHEEDDRQPVLAKCESDCDGHRVHEGAILIGPLKGRSIDWVRTQRGHGIHDPKDADAYQKTKAWFQETFIWDSGLKLWVEGQKRESWPEGVVLEEMPAFIPKDGILLVCGPCRTRTWHWERTQTDNVAAFHRKDHERSDRRAKEREEYLKRHPEVAK